MKKTKKAPQEAVSTAITELLAMDRAAKMAIIGHDGPRKNTETLAMVGHHADKTDEIQVISTEWQMALQQPEFGCLVKPISPLTEADLALAWKEYNNPFQKKRIIELIAQAIDPITHQPAGKEVQFGLIPTQLIHGSVPGRTIGVSGSLVWCENTPNREAGGPGLCSRDKHGWNEKTWVAISFDLYDQIGQVESYRNVGGEFILADSGASSALNLSPPM